MFSNRASSSLQDYCREIYDEGTIIKKQSVQERFNSYAVEFMKSIVAYALSIKLRVGDVNAGKSFSRIIIGDSTAFQLPSGFAVKYKGNGGGASKAGLKIQYCYDLLNPGILDISVYEAINSDYNYPLQDIRKNDLRIEDLGYFKLKRLKDIDEAEAYFLSRIRFGIKVFVLKDGEYVKYDLIKQINKLRTGQIIRQEVYIGEKEKLPVELIIEKVSKKVADEKRRKLKTDKQNKRKAITKQRLIFCDVNAFITNCDEKQLPTDLVRQCYSLRWQIEIMFKAWKSIFNIDKVKPMKIERFECLLYGCLIMIIASTQLLMYYKYKYRKKLKEEISELKFYKTIRSLSADMKIALKNTKSKLLQLLERMDRMVEQFCIKEQKKNKLKPLTILTNLKLT